MAGDDCAGYPPDRTGEGGSAALCPGSGPAGRGGRGNEVIPPGGRLSTASGAFAECLMIERSHAKLNARYATRVHA